MNVLDFFNDNWNHLLISKYSKQEEEQNNKNEYFDIYVNNEP